MDERQRSDKRLLLHHPLIKTSCSPANAHKHDYVLPYICFVKTGLVCVKQSILLLEGLSNKHKLRLYNFTVFTIYHSKCQLL